VLFKTKSRLLKMQLGLISYSLLRFFCLVARPAKDAGENLFLGLLTVIIKIASLMKHILLTKLMIRKMV